MRATTPHRTGIWYSGTELVRKEEATATALIAEVARDQEASQLARDAATAAAAAVLPLALDPVQQQLLILTQQLTALTTMVATN